jgi:hypothetical protein
MICPRRHPDVDPERDTVIVTTSTDRRASRIDERDRSVRRAMHADLRAT